MPALHEIARTRTNEFCAEIAELMPNELLRTVRESMKTGKQPTSRMPEIIQERTSVFCADLVKLMSSHLLQEVERKFLESGGPNPKPQRVAPARKQVKQPSRASDRTAVTPAEKRVWIAMQSMKTPVSSWDLAAKLKLGESTVRGQLKELVRKRLAEKTMEGQRAWYRPL